jgi:quercetin dioxygenase-like cupin family protein
VDPHEAEPGSRGDPHEHGQTEFLYVLSGSLQSQGQVLRAGSGYVAESGSTHDEFATADGATYLSIFKL